MRAFVTGGGGGIGNAIVARLSADGLEVTAPRQGELDLARREAIEAYFSAERGPFDVFVHCAGVNVPRPFEDLSAEDLDRTYAINTSSFVQVVGHVAPGMRARGSGRILAVSSIYGRVSRRKRLAYALSKHALVGAVQTLALELGGDGILVNALSPGFIDTVLTRRNNDAATLQSLARRTALGRLGTPEDVAEVAAFLCSPRNRYMTGADIVVDGGYSVGAFQES